MICYRCLSHTEGVFSGSALWFGSIPSFLARTRHGPGSRFTGTALVSYVRRVKKSVSLDERKKSQLQPQAKAFAVYVNYFSFSILAKFMKSILSLLYNHFPA